MARIWIAALALVLASVPAYAQDQQASRCAAPASIIIEGNERIPEATIRATIGLTPGQSLGPADIQRVIRSLYATTQFSDVRVSCTLQAAGDASLRVTVVERPLAGPITVEGTQAVSARLVRDRITVAEGTPLDPARIASSAAAIDSLYEARGFYLSQVEVDSTRQNGSIALTFRIREGGRLAISGVEIVGNERVSTAEIVGAMRSRPEGFWWFRRGAFDETEFAADVGQRIPDFYAGRGYIDAVVTQDTIIVDRELGKGMIRLTIQEGPQYRLGRFDVVGNQRFSSDQISGFYPFDDEGPTLGERVTDFIRRRQRTEGVFDLGRWQSATQRLSEAYNNEGYIFARVNPVADRATGPDGEPVVNLRWEIVEGNPAIVNRVEILGNDYTEDACIRRQLLTIPGSVFNREFLIRSYQSLGNMGFFESPMPAPDVRPANDEGDVDVIFTVREKRTGNIQFGASMGEGTGIGGFIGLDQPNLFGQCKRGAVQWQFGRYINDANVSFTDPAIGGSLYSGTVNAYHTRSRYVIADLGRSTRSGGNLRVGFPWRNSNWTRVFLTYGGESVRFGEGGLLGRVDSTLGLGTSFRSSVGLDVVHDTRIGLPFPTAGTSQTITAQFNGGPLGGNTNFQRYTTELRGYTPLWRIGGDRPGSQPMEVVFGLSGRAGALFGNPGQFFFTQQFSVGGVQYGEMLRGYPEFSITPEGFIGDTDNYTAQRNSFGSSFFTSTAELGLRLNPSIYVNTFFDAGNVWRRATDFNPTRLYRGAGLGASVITPLGPLGLDYAYGFDRTRRDPLTGIVRPAPRWQFHFRLGQLF